MLKSLNWFITVGPLYYSFSHEIYKIKLHKIYFSVLLIFVVNILRLEFFLFCFYRKILKQLWCYVSDGSHFRTLLICYYFFVGPWWKTFVKWLWKKKSTNILTKKSHKLVCHSKNMMFFHPKSFLLTQNDYISRSSLTNV